MATPNPNLIYRTDLSSSLTYAQLDGNFAYLSQSIANISTPVSTSYASTASYVDPLTQDVIITGSINFGDGSTIQSISASSGDGFGYTTLELKPDTSLSTDQYIVLDPTAPNHIHLRAGGTIDASNVYLYLGGENNHVKVDDYGTLEISSTNTITTKTGSNTQGLKIDFSNNIYELGDFDNYNNGTKIIVDDSNQNIILSGSILISGSIIPNVDGSATSSFDLGSPTAAWKDIYVSNGTINFLDSTGAVVQTMGTGNNQLTGDTFITGKLSQGTNITASGTGSHAEGTGSRAIGTYSHAEGWGTVAGLSNVSGIFAAHAEGRQTSASGRYSHAEGYLSKAAGEGSHAEGYNTFVQSGTAIYSHAEGHSTRVEGAYAHAEGTGSWAWSNFSHAEGINTNTYDFNDLIQTSGQPALGSHAEGEETITVGRASHAEGYQTYASGSWSHAEGSGCYTEGICSHAEGLGTLAMGDYQHVQGRYNVGFGDTTSLMVVGNGTADNARSDAFKVRMSGSIVLPTTQSAAPSWTGTDGEIVPATVGGQHFLYMWMSGAWRSGSFV